MSTKGTPIVTGFTGALVPDTHNFEITSPGDLTAIVVDGMELGDAINLRRRNYADDAWLPYTDGKGAVQLNTANTSVIPLKAGNYGLEGIVVGAVTIYTEGA